MLAYAASFPDRNSPELGAGMHVESASEYSFCLRIPLRGRAKTRQFAPFARAWM
jgi:hypothetical protein